MTFHGRVNCCNTFAGGSDYSVQYMFSTLHTALSSSQAESIGIMCRARSFNATQRDYWGISNPIPLYAWSVFEFTQANPKFWIAIQAGGTPGTNEGSNFDGPKGQFGSFTNQGGVVDDSNSVRSTVGISFAVRADGLSPWNGTTGGSPDAKGSPLWTPGASRLAMFPVINAPRGDQHTGRDAFHALWRPIFNPYPVGDRKLNRCYHHYIFSEDSLTILTGYWHGMFYSWTYLGRYRAIDSANPAKYCFVGYNRNDTADNDYNTQSIHGNDNTKYGSNLIGGDYVKNAATIDGNGLSQRYFGGVIDPIRWEGSRAAIIRPEQVTNEYYTNGGPSTTIGPRLDGYNIGLYLDSYASRGYIGEIDNINIVNGVPHGTTFNNRSWVTVGQWARTSKLAFRWGAPVSPHGTHSREGYMF